MKKKILLIAISSLILSACIPRLSSNGGSTDSGEYAKGKVVAGFPGLPRYPKSQVIETIGQKGSYGGTFVVDKDILKVVKFYNESLPKLGWEVKVRQQSQYNYLFEIKNSNLYGTVIVNTAADGETVAISMAASPR
ncbi:hypothetical protein A3I53_01715 [Candidatus Curtissbacteria bacterium RIFCSPLOWO2_02_FULL_40_13b]|uniref:PepSY domain-containing protein n=3 Tax=Candidatus Curtissiibacteriota TaxID=1752717 RepID=A0A1F5HXQ9_9BACT|nr:MAG: hypothetical protein A2693_04900 [Candidatus Curtissbacteria bacterium RIFCSPHIGHO2_01_FULL_40_12]OGE04859.1 MAG: hypothetical protein A3F45_01330 [Candidatus Curtissbacteria bacterium RIFCSPHIGHO2_12_FULL_41_17]OGE08840.1 MAG: hypothetical protein A3I53_01715 [Candidatus Curtissbacteria bacterium RIFCSPLOWO2_02_FULL_40_13b]